MQQIQTLELPAHVKKAIEAINTQIEYLTLIVNAPPPIDAKIELQYNKDEFINIPLYIFNQSIKEIIEWQIEIKKMNVEFLENSFVLKNILTNEYIKNGVCSIKYNIFYHTNNIDYAQRFNINDFVKNHVHINIYENTPIPTNILNTININ